jgi:hypothetical protein
MNQKKSPLDPTRGGRDRNRDDYMNWSGPSGPSGSQAWHSDDGDGRYWEKAQDPIIDRGYSSRNQTSTWWRDWESKTKTVFKHADR